MTLNITLKKGISKVLEEFESEDSSEQGKHTDFIFLEPEVEKLLGKTFKADVLTTADFDEDEAYIVEDLLLMSPSGTPFLIHPKWILKVEGEKITTSDIDKSKRYISITESFYLDTTEDKLVSKSDVSICTCGAPLDSDLPICSSCLIEKHAHVKNYSWVPSEWSFFGEQKGKHSKANPTWYGLELEYSLNSREPIAKLCYQHRENEELYLKSDSSIEDAAFRAEMVSQPASFSYLTGPDSWVHKLDTLDANASNKNGCHIHISRSAFKDNKHYAKFKYLILENKPLAEKVGGRAQTGFCEFIAQEAKIHLALKEKVGGAKRRAVNECHKDTIELRFMVSSNKSTQVLRYIEFIDSLIKYTAYHTNSASYQKYFQYIKKYQATYPTIYKFISKHQDLLDVEVTYSKPKMYTCNLEDLAPKYFQNVYTIHVDHSDGSSDDYSTSSDPESVAIYIRQGENGPYIKEFGRVSFLPEDKITVTYTKA